MLSTSRRFGPRMEHVKTIQLLSLSGLLLLGACSSIERGVVVRKGHSVKSATTTPTDSYWVDVRGKNRDGKKITERVQLFKRDWELFDKGDGISPHNYDMIGAAKALRASLKKLAQGKVTPTPKPARPFVKPATKPVHPVARRKSPPPTPAPKAASPRPRPAPETEALREARFRNVEARAHGDAEVRELKLKIQNAKTNEEQAAAWQEHRRALFQKMRELEPSLKDRIDQAENAGR